jgi:hypothetical protein
MVNSIAWQAHLDAVNTEANRERSRQYLNRAEHASLHGQWQAALDAANTALALYGKASAPGSFRLAEASLVQWSAQQCLGQAPNAEGYKRAREQLAKQVSSAHWMLRTDLLSHCTAHVKSK